MVELDGPPPRPMKPLRLLAVTNLYPPVARGGYGEICSDVMAGLAARGHRVTVLTSGTAGRPSTERGVEVRRELGYVLAGWRKPVPALQAVLNDQRAVQRALSDGVDAVLVWHMRGVMKTSLRLLHDARVPVFYFVHDRWVLYERAGPWLRPWPLVDRLGLAAARELVGGLVAPRVELRAPRIAEEGVVCFVSRWLQEEYARLGWRPRNCRVVPCGLDVDRFRAARVEPPRRPPKRLLFAGRIHPSKGVHVALEALARLPTDFALTIAGPEEDARYLSHLKARAEAVGVAGRVSWVGEVPRSDVVRLLRAHDVLVYPSIAEETFGLGLLEGLAASILVVASALGGPREFLRHEQNCLLFDPGDAAGLADRLHRLATDPELVASLERGAEETAKTSLGAVVDQVERLLELRRAGT